MSAVVASLGLTGVVLLAAAPMVTANASSRVAAANPGGENRIEPGNPEWPTVDVTQTVTVTAAPTETADPVVTKTMTVTPDPTVTRTTTVTPSDDPPSDPPPSRDQASPPPVLPTSQPITTPDQGQGTDPGVGAVPSSTEPPLTLAPATPSPDAVAESPPGFEEPSAESVPIEIRNASPEYDQIALSRQLAVPGILLVLLVVFAVFVFQGRLQRMAHAAAVRKAGPRPPGRHRGGGEPGTPGPYPVAPAYAPIIGFVPMQAYPMPPAPTPYAPGAYPPGYVNPQTGQPYPTGYPGQSFGMTPGYPQGQPTVPDPAYGGYTFPQAGFQAGGPQPGAGTQSGQASPQQPYPTGQWPDPGQAAPGGSGAAGGSGDLSGTSDSVSGLGAEQGRGSERPSGDHPSGRYGSQDPRSRLFDDDPRVRDEDDEPTSLLYDRPSRRALEPGPTSIPGPPVETVSVERIGPDGQPMKTPPVRGTQAFPTVQDDSGGDRPTASDPSAADAPPEDVKKRRPWRRSK